MKTVNHKLSPKCIHRIREQGYQNYSDKEIRALAYGNRFAYRLCVFLLIIGIVFNSIPILSLMFVVAFMGVVLPNHPFDYIYNHVLSKRMDKPSLPPRSNQLKFACSLATLFIGTIIYLMYNNFMTAAHIVGGILISIAMLVSTIDLCIPSKIYNAIFKKTTRTV